MNNIDEYVEKIQELSYEFYEKLKNITNSYDENMFISDVEIQINEIPLVSFEYAVRSGSPKLKTYDVSENTKCLTYRTIGNKAHIVLNSVELADSNKSDKEEK